LKELLTGTYRKERSGIKALKRALSVSWGDWDKCAALASTARYENYSEIFEYLRNANAHKGDGKNGTTQKELFIGALRLVRDRTLRMEGLALLDYLWNEALKSTIFSGLGLENIMTVRYEAGELYFPRANDFALERYREMILREKRGVPLPSAEIRDGALREGYERLLDGLGLDLKSLSTLRDWGISAPSEPRPPFVMPRGLELTEGTDGGVGPAGLLDEENDVVREQGKGAQRTRSALLSFTLPPGSYATVVVKALLG
jgi:tRNA(Glu) U13 pseudouridine synthase TruD